MKVWYANDLFHSPSNLPTDSPVYVKGEADAVIAEIAKERKEALDDNIIKDVEIAKLHQAIVNFYSDCDWLTDPTQEQLVALFLQEYKVK
jgi:hypothetical protein